MLQGRHFKMQSIDIGVHLHTCRLFQSVILVYKRVSSGGRFLLVGPEFCKVVIITTPFQSRYSTPFLFCKPFFNPFSIPLSTPFPSLYYPFSVPFVSLFSVPVVSLFLSLCYPLICTVCLSLVNAQRPTLFKRLTLSNA